MNQKDAIGVATSFITAAVRQRAAERMEAYPDGLCPSAHRQGPCLRYDPESDTCCRLA